MRFWTGLLWALLLVPAVVYAEGLTQLSFGPGEGSETGSTEPPLIACDDFRSFRYDVGTTRHYQRYVGVLEPVSSPDQAAASACAEAGTSLPWSDPSLKCGECKARNPDGPRETYTCMEKVMFNNSPNTSVACTATCRDTRIASVTLGGDGTEVASGSVYLCDVTIVVTSTISGMVKCMKKPALCE